MLVTQDRFTDVPWTILQDQQRNGADVGLVSNPHRDYRHVVPLSTCSVGWTRVLYWAAQTRDHHAKDLPLYQEWKAVHTIVCFKFDMDLSTLAVSAKPVHFRFSLAPQIALRLTTFPPSGNPILGNGAYQVHLTARLSICLWVPLRACPRPYVGIITMNDSASLGQSKFAT